MNLTFDGIRPKYSKPLLSVADTIAYECKPLSHINNISLVTERNNLKALTLSPILYGQIKASNIKCVPVSTKITNLAKGKCSSCTWTATWTTKNSGIFITVWDI